MQARSGKLSSYTTTSEGRTVLPANIKRLQEVQFLRRQQPMSTSVVDHSGQNAVTEAVARAGNRLLSSVEVSVSKIFWAGAGWQAASLLATNLGFASNSLGFYLTVGAGDLSGVFLGHTAYYALKKAYMSDPSIDLRREAQTASLLGGAAFFSGFTWQIAVDSARALSGGAFDPTMIGAGVACAAAFFAGMRVMRQLLSRPLPAVEAANYPNLKSDAQLSVAIGGAAAAFVGTDASFGAEANWLLPLVGISPEASALAGVGLAGLSTSLGFMAVQAGMAAVMPRRRCWIDKDAKLA